MPFPLLEDFPDPGIEPRSPILRQFLYHLSHQEIIVDFLLALQELRETRGREGTQTDARSGPQWLQKIFLILDSSKYFLSGGIPR